MKKNNLHFHLKPGSKVFYMLFTKNRVIINKSIQHLLLLMILLLSGLSYSQLAQETFETGIPSTWSTFNNTFGITTWSSTTEGYAGSNGIMINPALDNIGQGNTAEYFMVTPQFPTPVGGEIRFYTKQGSVTNNGTIYQIRISTASQPDIAGFTIPIATWTETQLNTNSTTYEEKIVTLPPSIPAGLNIYIAFVAKNTQTGTTASGDSWFVDNVRIIPACSKVSGISTVLSATSAGISWTHPSATDFSIQVVPYGTSPAATGTTVNSLSYNATDLDPETYYDVYLKTICDSETVSLWAGPFTFVTPSAGFTCDAPIIIPSDVTTPYVLSANLQNYNNTTSYVTYDSQDLSCLPTNASPTTNYLNGDHVYLSYTPSTSGLVNLNQTTTVISGGGGNNCYNKYSSVFIFDDCTGIGTSASCLASMITTPTDDSATISNFYVQAGTTYIIVISSQLTQNAGICFTFTISGSTCPSPSGLSYSDLLQNSVNVSWDNVQNLVSNWEYVAIPASAGAPNGSETLLITSTNTNNPITGLTADTNYNLYVRSVCGGTAGEWSAPYPFKTQCTVFPTPYSTNFTGASASNPEPCWTSMNLNNDSAKWTYSQLGTQGQYATMPFINSGNNNYDLLVSPQIDLSGSPKRLRFKYQTYGSGLQATFTVKLSTTGIGEDNFTTTLIPTASYSTLGNDSGWTEMIVSLPTEITSSANIAWILYPGDAQAATRLNIDDVFIEDLPACSDPINPSVTASSVTMTAAELTWTNALPTDTQWEVSVQPYGTGIPTGAGLLVDTNPYTITNLDPSTKYEFYVRTHCNDVDLSQWVGPVIFNTLCDAQTVPYYESYNTTDTSSKKFCWSTNNIAGDNAKWEILDTEARIIALGAGFSNPFTQFDDWLISAPVVVTGQKKVSFNYRSATQIPNFPNSRGALQVLISTTDTNPSSFTELTPMFVFTNSAYEEYSSLFTANGTVYIALRVPPDMPNPSNSGILMVDDFRIEDAAVCPEPSGLNATNITLTSANLSWLAGNTETSWEIVVQNANAGIPQGTGTVVNTTPSFNATPLNPGTAYEFYVRAICTTENSAWQGPFKFSTLCAAFSTPFIETFEPDSPSENCWTIYNNNEDNKFWNLNQTVQPIFGQQMASLFTGSNGNNNDWMITPTITVQPNQRLRFYYKVKDSYFQEDLLVKLSTNGLDISQFTTTLFDTGTNYINNEEYKEMVINLTGITTTTDVNIAFHVPQMPPNPWNYRGQFLFIDNVIIEDIPACPSVTNVVTSNIIDNAATTNWESTGTESAWEISLQPFGTPAPVGNTLPEYLNTTTAHPYTFNNLTSSTQYQYYIRAICATDSQSEWVGPYTFTTRCDFENVCQYTISLSNGSTGHVSGSLDIMQNGVVMQELIFPNANVTTPVDNIVYMCTGVEFNLYWNGIFGGSGLQYSQAQVIIKDENNNIVWTSPLGLGTVNTTLYSGTSTCGTITCPQPTNLTVNDLGVLSWTPGNTESQWEVFIQPLNNGTIPQNGIIVNTPSYTPIASDFNNATAGAYEFLVRAICGDTDTSYWAGAKTFIRNDDAQNAITLAINSGSLCEVNTTNASFNGATASAEVMSCEGVNGGDIWYQFTAQAKVHSIELSDFAPGSYWTQSYQGPWPNITMTLYEVQTDGSLVEKGCSYNNSMVTMYSTELVEGFTYKLRLTLNDTTPNTKTFNICVTTPEACDLNAFNYDFEKIPMQNVTGIYTIINSLVVPGWRTNTDREAMFFNEGSNSPSVFPYSGGQCVQLVQDGPENWNPTDPNIKGLYKDYDTSELFEIDYSFASATRTNAVTTLQLFAGPPTGPFVLVTEDFANSLVWELISGTYTIPTGQNTTRFIFRVKENAIGHLLDAANFMPNTDIITNSSTIDCSQTPTIILEAKGNGTWTADENNPSITVLDASSIGVATVTGFSTSGDYIFHWKTKYCDKTVTFNYQGVSETPVVESPIVYCLNDTATPLTANVGEDFILAWYDVPTGGTATTTAPIPNTTTAGTQTFYVAAQNAEGCEGPRVAIEVQVNTIATASITGTTTICQDDNAIITFVGTPNAVVTFTVNGTEQTITLDGTGDATLNSGALQATTTYVLVSVEIPGITSCSQVLTDSVVITVNNSANQNLTFSYAVVCLSTTSNPLPVLPTNFTTGGTFSAVGIIINTGTGEIDLTSATSGTYEVTYTVLADEVNCAIGGTFTTSVILNDEITPTTQFNYEDIYCSNATNLIPSLADGFTTGGTFSSTPGLSIDSVTGEINVSQSTAGTYVITYEVTADPDNCLLAGSSQDTIIIMQTPETQVVDLCDDTVLFLQAQPLNNSYDADSANYTWSDTANSDLGITADLFDVGSYLMQNPSVTIPFTISVTVDVENCSTTSSFLVDDNACVKIPRGISPNNDGDNDNFNLTGLGVKELIIFNRYGTNVYSFKGNYTNQFDGRSHQGDDLPDGTYFYNIVKENGKSITGWVYIIRQY